MKSHGLVFISLFIGLFGLSCSEKAGNFHGGFIPAPPGSADKACVLVEVYGHNGEMHVRNITSGTVKIFVNDCCDEGYSKVFEVHAHENRSFALPFSKRCIVRIRAVDANNCTYIIDKVVGEK